MKIHLFGASTPTGLALHNFAQTDVIGYSRGFSAHEDWLHTADLTDSANFQPADFPDSAAIWISFAPIWIFSTFLEELEINHPERLQGMRGLIACSSSSSITKRFAANRFDRNLVSSLTAAEDLLLTTCRRLSVPCRILRPTLIYGKVEGIGDHNLSRLLQLMRRLPVLPLPTDSGLRQPIHASQLAAVALHLAERLAGPGWDSSLPERIALGGDTTLTYAEMIRALQNAQPPGDPARRCCLLSIPNRLFFLIAAPLLLRSPKAFEAVLRVGGNLSGFTPVHQILRIEAQPFPVLPLA